MSIIVQKYGGSSVADPEKIKKIAQLISNVKKEGYDVAVVVSAMGKTTDSLIELAKQVSSEPPKREMDMLLSTGERVTMSLLCMALNSLGIDAVSLTGSQAGIITNDRHNDARVIEVRPFRVFDELDRGRVVVVGGFQGVSYRRDITTLGRGGSDTSAVALAAALNAERCEIYSDVDGVYSADPSVVKDAKHLPEISYEQMQEMSEAGAKVLNAQAVQFAKESKIAIYARSTFKQGRETIVRKFPAGLSKGVKAVVYENDISRIEYLSGEDEKIISLLSFLEQKQIPVKEFSYSKAEGGNKVSFLVSQKNIYNVEKIEAELIAEFGSCLKIEHGFGTASLIGDGINKDNTILLETLSILKKENIKILGIATTSFRISFLLEKTFVKNTVLLCHNRWIEDKV
ncbi:MAG: aspartate kinase [Ignavibacteriaceae bacterium]|nr:aspartate kinase [Ignavibacteriaceae bacterium]